MPYKELPARLKQIIPSEHGQGLFRNVFNSQMKSGKSEAVSFASAWAALERAGYKKGGDGKWTRVEKASGAIPLYMKRPVLNAESLQKWAREQGFTSTLDPDDMHVTVIYSKQPFSQTLSRIALSESGIECWQNIVVRGGKRSIERLGENGEAVVLSIESAELAEENLRYREMGASSDWMGYKPHITITYNSSDLDVKNMEPFEGDIVLGSLTVHPLDENWKDDVTEIPVEKAESYSPPESARNNARRVLRWKEKYGDEVKGMTRVGWTRANQLASGENLSRETVGRMAAFARHRKNAEVDPKYKDEPWRDAGYVAWLGWGGTTGIEWASKQIDKRQIDDDVFTMSDEARARSMALGLNGEIHVEHEDGQQAVYVPGRNEDEYERKISEIAGIESESQEKGLLDRAISAIIAAVMEKISVNKSVEGAEVLKMDDEQRIVWGWAYVSTLDGELLVDTQGDSIEPAEMEKMANNFMLGERVGKAMHDGDKVGTVIHSMPLTKDLMKAFDIESNREGWIIGYKVHDDKVWKAFKSGALKGFSIGGSAGDAEEY